MPNILPVNIKKPSPNLLTLMIHMFQVSFMQCVGKTKTTFSVQLNNHKKESKKKDTILA